MNSPLDNWPIDSNLSSTTALCERVTSLLKKVTIVIIIFSPGQSANNVSNANNKWEPQRKAVGAGYEHFLAVNHITLNSNSLGVLQSTMVMQHFGAGGGGGKQDSLRSR